MVEQNLKVTKAGRDFRLSQRYCCGSSLLGCDAVLTGQELPNIRNRAETSSRVSSSVCGVH
jgi:hypothetical protein